MLRGRDERRRSRKHGGERRMKAGGRAAGGASPVDSPAGGRTEVRFDSPAGGRDGGSWARSIVASWDREVGAKNRRQ